MNVALKQELPHKTRVHAGCELQGYETLFDELSYWIDTKGIEGEIPAGLEGTLFLNCPGRNKIGDQQYGHWFDGDGMISAVTIKDGSVHYKNRYVRTPKYIDETAAQKIMYRGVGTQIPGGMLKNMFRTPGNAANTSVIMHGGKLLALWEGGKPWELNPATLETIGEFTYEDGLSSSQLLAHTRASILERVTSITSVCLAYQSPSYISTKLILREILWPIPRNTWVIIPCVTILRLLRNTRCSYCVPPLCARRLNSCLACAVFLSPLNLITLKKQKSLCWSWPRLSWFENMSSTASSVSILAMHGNRVTKSLSMLCV